MLLAKHKETVPNLRYDSLHPAITRAVIKLTVAPAVSITD